jgi:hypothetical protein
MKRGQSLPYVAGMIILLDCTLPDIKDALRRDGHSVTKCVVESEGKGNSM